MREHERVVNESNRSARGRVNSPTQQTSKGARESVANTMLLDDQELEVTAQHEKKARESKRAANKLNKSMRGRVN